ncbi:DUF16 domain-containing protein [Desulfosporosinus nitroreducens]|uniref:DUF16 domain-containing protein n=1 Tax=Desulfosporosinus nitroreducens TaxID=2018668 RepID=A0ABT8QWG9_9FIRM|nr:DUF16 domain-containing protein [Desulfosporosinus nitroreducens]MDO0824388.1 DUF16 domain-containing protein [Desulfosporosinus nitroreducens]
MEDKILQALEGLSNQITGLSGKVDNQGDKITALTEKVDNQGNQITTLTEKVDSQGNQITALTEKVDSQGDKITALTEKVDSQGNQITALTEKVDTQGTQIKENTLILKALEHLAQINKAEHDKMSFNIAEISGEIKAIRKDLLNVELITASNWGDIVRLKSVK